jgi:hypothetical protein
MGKRAGLLEVAAASVLVVGAVIGIRSGLLPTGVTVQPSQNSTTSDLPLHLESSLAPMWTPAASEFANLLPSPTDTPGLEPTPTSTPGASPVRTPKPTAEPTAKPTAKPTAEPAATPHPGLAMYFTVAPNPAAAFTDVTWTIKLVPVGVTYSHIVVSWRGAILWFNTCHPACTITERTGTATWDVPVQSTTYLRMAGTVGAVSQGGYSEASAMIETSATPVYCLRDCYQVLRLTFI